MKNLIALSFALMSLNSFAGEKFYYSAQFEVVDVKELCPTIPGRPTCRAIGAKIVLEARLGCLDKLVFSDFEVKEHHGRGVKVIATSLVQGDRDSLVALCNRIPTIRKEVFSATAESIEDVTVVNRKIQVQH